MYIDFDISQDLTSAVSWVFSPDKLLAASSARRHILLVQETSDMSSVLGYAVGNVWLYRRCTSQGIIDSKVLLDGDDFLKRVSRDGFKNSSIRLSSTKKTSSKVNIEEVTEIVEGKVKSAGNILIPCYSGDLADLDPPSYDNWSLLLTIDDVYSYQDVCKVINLFSSLKTTTPRQAVWLRNEDNTLSITSTEKGGDRGNSMINYELDTPMSDDFRLAIAAPYLLKTSQVSSGLSNINIYVDSLENPTRIKFSGDLGFIDLPILEDYTCQALSKGAMRFFYQEEGVGLEEVCSKTFNLPQVEKGLSIQVSKNGSRKDRLLEFIEESLVITKRSDSERLELSEVPTWTTDGGGTWTNLVIDHDFLMSAITTMDFYINLKLKAFAKQAAFEEVDIKDTKYSELDSLEDLQDLGIKEEDSAVLQYKLVTITQKVLRHTNGLEQWFLFLSNIEFPRCEMLVICTKPKEKPGD